MISAQVYCGPSIKGVARQYAVYHGELPEAMQDFIQEHPDAEGLLVTAEQLSSMRKALETKGTKEARLYQRIKAEL